MKTLFKITLLIIVLTTQSSCERILFGKGDGVKKVERYFLIGQVINSETQEPYPGLKLYVDFWDKEDGRYYPETNSGQVFETDEFGRFALTGDRAKNGHVYIAICKEIGSSRTYNGKSHRIKAVTNKEIFLEY